jgi:membrane-bound lytic murein transglycosylase MltF
MVNNPTQLLSWIINQVHTVIYNTEKIILSLATYDIERGNLIETKSPPSI